jgi:glycerate kinase
MRAFELVPGIEVVMQETGFDQQLVDADVVVTGEGHIDAQTAFGKTALGVARRAAAAGVPCLAIGGGVTPEGSAALAGARAVAVPVLDGPTTLEEAMSNAASIVATAGERLARLVELGVVVGGRRGSRGTGVEAAVGAASGAPGAVAGARAGEPAA